MNYKKLYPDWKHGDRKDAVWLKDIDSMHAFMPYLMPNRADNEAVLLETVDLTAVEDYIARKNAEDPEFKYTIFHILCAALGKTIVLNPKLNRFIAGHRLYQRRDISLTFVVKKKFAESADEALAIFAFDQSSEVSPLDQFRERLYKIIYSVRKENKTDGTTAIMDVLVKLPRWMLRGVMGILNFLDYYGQVPAAISKDDPYNATVFVSNLGSIKMKANYHHLANWGTNSVFCIIGEKHQEPFFDPVTGTYELRTAVDLGLTIDERIADGLYFGQAVKLLRELLAHPELLERPLMESVEWVKL